MTLFIKRILFCFLVLSSCAIPEKQNANDTTEPADTTAVSPADAANEKTTTSEKPDSISVALLFINDYIKHLNSGDPFDRMSWVENNELATDEFKASYKKLFTEAFEDDPEAGLDYDPILNAQDTPDGFEFVRLEDHEYVVMKGTDQPQFTNVLRVRFVVDRWLVEGTGVVNIPEEKRGLK
jgi:hypothetical protein